MYHPKYNDRLFFGMIGAFLGGVLVRSFFEISLGVCLGFLVVIFAIALYTARKNLVATVVSLVCILMFFVGIFRLDLWQSATQQQSMLLDSSATYHARIVSEPEYQTNRQRFVVRLVDTSFRGKVLVTTDRYPEYHFGDHILVSGNFKQPENFITDTGREFDYVSHLYKDKILYTVSFADISLVEARAFGGVRRVLFSIKGSFLGAIERIIPDPESALLGGILLGVKQSLGDELEQSFIDTGTIHIVVLSGYNVTIVSEAIVRLFQSITSSQFAIVFGSVGIALFALLTGLGATTVRASIMGILGLLARITGRTYDIVRALFLTAFCMVMYNPMTLVFDVSFQLSFIATLGLIIITPIVESWRFVRVLPSWIGVRNIFASTLATQIAVLPYLLYKIGTLSIISPLANLLVLPAIPLAMGLGFGAGLVEMISSLGSWPLAWIAYFLLRYVVVVVEGLASFSWSSVVVPPIPFLVVLLLYGVIGYWVYRVYRNPRFRIIFHS